MKFQTFARLILSYIVSYIVEKIDFLYSVFSGQGCGGQQTFPYRREKLSAQFCIFEKEIFIFSKKSDDLVYTFYYFYDTHSPQPLLGQVFLNWIRAQKIDRLTLIVRAHLFIAKKKGPDHLFGYDFDWKYDPEKRRT
jgi:hypothetical protein